MKNLAQQKLVDFKKREQERKALLVAQDKIEADLELNLFETGVLVGDLRALGFPLKCAYPL